MRVPLSLSILLAILVPMSLWWMSTRKMDFLTPPSSAELAAIRQKTTASLPPSISEPPKAPPQAPLAKAANPSPEKKPEPSIEIGDLNPTPGLSTYAELAPKGARHLIELASLLETAGEFPRTLLAWERVLDSTKAEPAQVAAALAAIKRIRPTLPNWNIDPDGAISVIIHASTGTKLEKNLASILEQNAHDLEHASSGILKVTAEITTKTNSKAPPKGPSKRKSNPANVATPVAIRLTGPTENSPTSETLTFAVTKPEDLQAEILRRIFQLISSRLEQVRALPPIAADDDEAPLDALQCRITRLQWEKFARSLNAPPNPNP